MVTEAFMVDGPHRQKNGHGGNMELKDLDPTNFQFPYLKLFQQQRKPIAWLNAKIDGKKSLALVSLV